MVKNNVWLSMRHFVTQEYLNGIYMGQQQYKICNTDIKTNGLLDKIKECTIFSSTLARCTQTVDYVISTYSDINFRVVYSNNLVERGLGEFEGKSKILIRKDKKYFNDGLFIVEKTPPKGESLTDFRSRVNSEVQIIKEESKHTNILVISHLQVLRMIKFCIDESFDYTNWHNIQYLHGEITRENYGKP